MPQPKFANAQIPQVRVWDLPSRIWHWALVAGLTVSIYTGLTGSIASMDWHLKSGYAVLVLLLFRLVWGVCGGVYLRFGCYWRSLLESSKQPQPHTRPGVFMLLGLLALLAIQIATGLFATDDLFIEGPFNNYVADATASTLSWLHRRNFWLIVGLAAVHTGAIAYYWLCKQDPLARAMFNGYKALEHHSAQSRNHLLRALLIVSSASGLVWWVLERY